jgi:cobyrinic acid a,c-diamide synthase
VILNNLGGSRHESKLRAVIEHYTDVEVIGAVQHDASMQIAERHLGLVPANEQQAALSRIQQVGERVAAQVDLERLLDIADSAAALDLALATRGSSSDSTVRVGIAHDQAFGFYYSEDLDTLRAANVDLIEIDTIRLRELPKLDGLIIGGGFPEVFMDELESNTTLRSSIRSAIESGLPTYAECGGLMYLSRSLSWKGRTRKMVGVVPGDTMMHAHPVGRGYARLQPTGNDRWQEQVEIPAHEFHYSSLENLPVDSIYAYQVKRGHGIDGRHDGYQIHNLLAAYVHRRGSGTQGWITPFLNQVRAYKARATA